MSRRPIAAAPSSGLPATFSPDFGEKGHKSTGELYDPCNDR
jgi:hypothetical protein